MTECKGCHKESSFNLVDGLCWICIKKLREGKNAKTK